MKQIDRRILILVLFFISFGFIRADTALAERWEYKIEDKIDINEEKTNAVVDTVKHEIRLPKSLPNMVDFLGDGFEYIVLTPEGVEKVNTDGSMTLIVEKDDSNPISAIAGSGNYPDFIVARETTITHYSFTGSEYSENLLLASGGYTNILSVGTKELDHAALASDGNITYQAFTGDAMVPATALSPQGFTNPIAMTVFKDHYGIAVVDENEVKYFKEGSSVTSTISGLTNVLSVSAADGGNIAVVANNQVKHYNLLEDSTFAYNSHLSITSSLTSPTCIALRPGSYDRIIVDGNNVNYYMWTGSDFIKNETMSKEITGLQDIGKYLPKAVAESIVYTLSGGKTATHVKLWIDPALNPQEPDTIIKWFVSSQEDEWIEAELGQWTALSEPGNKLRWKAELSTTNRDKTPIINPIIVMQTNSKPNPPNIIVPPISGSDRCYLNTSPEIRWTFEDPDNNPPESTDQQSGYQVIILANGNEIENSGYIPGELTSYVVDKGSTSKLFNTGVNAFTAQVVVWDEAGVESDPAEKDFCVIAFEQPYTEITTPVSSGFISKWANINQLPITKAGGLVTVFVNSLGVSNAPVFEFPYLDKQSSVLSAEEDKDGTKGLNKRWKISFYTDANTEVCPDGTIVNGYFDGSGIPSLMFLDQTYNQDNLPENNPMLNDEKWWKWEGYRWWAEGVVKINDTAFKNWSVILQGSKRE